MLSTGGTLLDGYAIFVLGVAMPIIIAGFVTDQTSSPTLMNAGGVLAVVPPLVLALIFQRLIVSGITSGAVKG